MGTFALQKGYYFRSLCFGRFAPQQFEMTTIHDVIQGGMIGWPLMILVFIAVYLVFFRDTDKPHKEKHPHR